MVEVSQLFVLLPLTRHSFSSIRIDCTLRDLLLERLLGQYFLCRIEEVLNWSLVYCGPCNIQLAARMKPLYAV